MTERETWASRVGFVLAAVGSAVGLGNIWQFPFKTGQFGGASFLLVYLVAAVGIGLPALLAEFVVGRRANRNTIDAFGALGGRRWKLVGALGLAIGFWILSYYSVVGGWVIRYLLASPTGAYFGDASGFFGAVSAGPGALVTHAVFMACVVSVVALGVENGIERATKVMVPSVLLILAGLAAYAFTLDGAGAGYAYFLSPDLAALSNNLTDIVPFAVGQAFFSLSLGMGAMVTYASYVDGEDSLVADAGSIVLLNTLVGVLAGLVVFPLLFAQGIDPNTSGPGAVFVSVAGAFANLPAGRLLGTAFFAVVLVAALSSAISLLEVVVSYVVDNTRVGRLPAATGIGGGLFLLGGALGAVDRVARLVRHARVQTAAPDLGALYPAVRRLEAKVRRPSPRCSAGRDSTVASAARGSGRSGSSWSSPSSGRSRSACGRCSSAARSSRRSDQGRDSRGDPSNGSIARPDSVLSREGVCSNSHLLRYRLHTYLYLYMNLHSS
ncbi:sodium-dependent transporter [Salinigranum sp. GCM10025319]|uniref:sodium-dependent transporter n=1 Tax=Salinigranum sp. GCM10025319 TaxID=3252687 RepID=UPI00360EA3CB